jgi:hypothetical protein|tara:strand:+ start:604 stop:777 length:174 start_codon:yes stop_codon:yes gene_type:complete
MRHPKDRMEGTQMPTNIPSSLWPPNHSATEKRNEMNAAKINKIFPYFIRFTVTTILL